MSASTQGPDGIAKRAWLHVTVPGTVLILVLWWLLMLVGLGYIIAALAASGIGWVCWGYLVKRWILWAHGNGASPQHILQVGRRAHAIWDHTTVDKVLADQK